MNYRLDIQYDGTRYEGWQRQKTTGNTFRGKSKKSCPGCWMHLFRSTAREEQMQAYTQKARWLMCTWIQRKTVRRSAHT